MQMPFLRATNFTKRVKKEVCRNYLHESKLVVCAVAVYQIHLLVCTTH